MWLMINTYLIIQPLKQNYWACKFIDKVDWWSLIVSSFISWKDAVEEVTIKSYQLMRWTSHSKTKMMRHFLTDKIVDIMRVIFLRVCSHQRQITNLIINSAKELVFMFIQTNSKNIEWLNYSTQNGTKLHFSSFNQSTNKNDHMDMVIG